jgi:hypothetical protein
MKLKQRPRLALILTQKQQCRSWASIQCLDEIHKYYDVTYLAPESCKSELSDYLKDRGIAKYFHVPANQFLEKSLSESLLIKHKKWPSYRKRLLYQFVDYPKTKWKIVYLMRIFRGLVQKKHFILRLLSSQFDNQKSILENEELSQLTFRLTGFDFVLVISNVSDLANEIATKSAENSDLPWIQVVENWDNLSSKLCPSKAANSLIVWGEQTKRHAMEMHSIAEDRIQIVGSSRIPNEVRINELRNKFCSIQESNKLKVFYAGFGGESFACIEEIYRSLLLDYSDYEIEIVFRVHPNSLKQNGREFYEDWPTHIQVEFPNLNKNGQSDWPELTDDLYISMLNADIVIGTPSTFLLEALTFRMPIILDFRDRDPGYFTSRRAFEDLTHFKEILSDSTFNRFYFAREVPTAVKRELAHGGSRDKITKHLLFNDSNNYFSRLVQFMNIYLHR